MRLALFAVLALAASIALVQPVAAGPITYVESGQISGTVGSTTLTNANFAFTFYGDTTNITGSAATAWYNVATSTGITIGVSNGSFSTAAQVTVNPNVGIVGFCNVAPCISGITFLSAGAVGYSLATGISIPETSLYAAVGSLSTSLGTLTITGAQNLLFTATATPEPGTIGMLGAGLVALAFLRKRIG